MSPVYVKVKGIDTVVPEHPGWVAIPRDVPMQAGDVWALPFRRASYASALKAPHPDRRVHPGQTANQHGYDPDVAIYRPIPGYEGSPVVVSPVQAASPPVPAVPVPTWSEVTPLFADTMIERGDVIVNDSDTLSQALTGGTGGTQGGSIVAYGMAGSTFAHYVDEHSLWRRSPPLQIDQWGTILCDDPITAAARVKRVPMLPVPPAPPSSPAARKALDGASPRGRWVQHTLFSTRIRLGDIMARGATSRACIGKDKPGCVVMEVGNGAIGHRWGDYVEKDLFLWRWVDGGAPSPSAAPSAESAAVDGSALTVWLEITEPTTIIAPGDVLLDGDPSSFDPSLVSPSSGATSVGIILTRERNGNHLFTRPISEIAASTRRLYRAFPKWSRLTDESLPMEEGDVVCTASYRDHPEVVARGGVAGAGIVIGKLGPKHGYTVRSYTATGALTVWRLTERLGVGAAVGRAGGGSPKLGAYKGLASSKGNVSWRAPLTLP